MNEVFLMGEIVAEIKFDFMLNSKKKSIVHFYLKTLGGEKIKIVGYDGIADFCYSRLSKGDSINVSIISGAVNASFKFFSKYL